MLTADMFKYTWQSDMFQLGCKALTFLSIYTDETGNVSTIIQRAEMFKWHNSTIMQSADMFQYTDEIGMVQLWCKALTCLSIPDKMTCFNYDDIFKYIYRRN